MVPRMTPRFPILRRFLPTPLFLRVKRRLSRRYWLTSELGMYAPYSAGEMRLRSQMTIECALEVPERILNLIQLSVDADGNSSEIDATPLARY